MVKGNEWSMVVAGDVVVAGCDALAARRGELVAECGEVAEALAGADLAIANLEAPTAPAGAGITKLGPRLHMEAGALSSIAGLGFDAVGLANNHIMDQGPAGLDATLAACAEHGLATFGAGVDAEAAARPLVLERRGRTFALIGMAEHEFSIAENGAEGACGLDAITLVALLEEWIAKADDVVVVLHGGLEHFPYPTPGLRRFARFAVERGASAVICQHTHILGCMELWRDRPIVYGQGNFLFQYPTVCPTWWRGALIELTFGDDVAARWIPVASERDVVGARLPAPEERARLLAEIEARSERLATPGALEEEFRRYARRHGRWYRSLLEGWPRPLRRLDRRWGILDRFRGAERAATQFGMLACESQREALLEDLRESAGLYQSERRRRES